MLCATPFAGGDLADLQAPPTCLGSCGKRSGQNMITAEAVIAISTDESTRGQGRKSWQGRQQ